MGFPFLSPPPHHHQITVSEFICCLQGGKSRWFSNEKTPFLTVIRGIAGSTSSSTRPAKRVALALASLGTGDAPGSTRRPTPEGHLTDGYGASARTADSGRPGEATGQRIPRAGRCERTGRRLAPGAGPGPPKRGLLSTDTPFPGGGSDAPLRTAGFAWFWVFRSCRFLLFCFRGVSAHLSHTRARPRPSQGDIRAHPSPDLAPGQVLGHGDFVECPSSEPPSVDISDIRRVLWRSVRLGALSRSETLEITFRPHLPFAFVRCRWDPHRPLLLGLHPWKRPICISCKTSICKVPGP